MNERESKQVADLAEIYGQSTVGPWIDIQGQLQTISGTLLLTTFVKGVGVRACFDQIADGEFCAAAKNTFPILICDNLRLVGLLRDKEIELLNKDGVELDLRKQLKKAEQQRDEARGQVTALRAQLQEAEMEISRAARGAYEEGQEAARAAREEGF